jgi:hypothetical protein
LIPVLPILGLKIDSFSTMIFGFGLSDEMPKGWFKAGNMPDSYKIGSDNTVFKNGHKSTVIESIDKNIEGFTTIMQTCNAKDYLGKRIKMTGYIKSENVADCAGMWLRVDSRTENESLSFDNMQDRPIKGNSDWTKCEIILDVPAGSSTLNFGALISGTGKIWFDNISFVIVSTLTNEIPKDLKDMPVPDKPANLDFEE